MTVVADENEVPKEGGSGSQAALDYFKDEYDSKERFCSYWHQVDEAKAARPSEILEIGKGNGFFSTYMRHRRAKVVSLDFDIRVRPECNASVTHIPFKNDAFDLVVCYEVLEHMPYELFSQALREINRVARRRVVISLPDLSPVWRYLIKIPKMGELKILLPQPRIKPVKYEFNGDHYWNIGTQGFPLAKIIREISQAGFNIEKNYRVFEIPWHRFFKLQKMG